MVNRVSSFFPKGLVLTLCDMGYVFYVAFCIKYNFINYLNVSFSGSITLVVEERADYLEF